MCFWPKVPTGKDSVFLILVCALDCFCMSPQDYDNAERLVHAREVQGFYRDGARIGLFHALSTSWWQQRFTWQRTLNHMPHAVVFVFNGAQVPFFHGESRDFFIRVFDDCKKAGECVIC